MRVETAPRIPPTSRTPLHATPHARVVGSAAREKSYRGKNRPACPRTVLGLAQQRVALMCGPGPGAPVGVQKKWRTFVPFTCARAVGAARTAAPSRVGEVNQGKTEAQDCQSNTKTKNAKKQRGGAVSPGKTLAGDDLSSPGKTLAGAAHPNTNKASHPRAHDLQHYRPRWARARESPLWWHADLCEDIFKIR